MKVKYRELHPSDYNQIARLIIHTWKFDNFCNKPNVIQHFGLSYLFKCMSNQTYNRVAVINGNIAGIIIGADHRKKVNNLYYNLRYIYQIILCTFSKELRSNSNTLFEYSKNMDDMYSNIEIKLDAEINLFIVDEKYRGLGIGKNLYHNLIQHFKDTNISTYYLHTDTACNYKFYLHQGMEILSEKKTSLCYSGEENITMYILGSQLS